MNAMVQTTEPELLPRSQPLAFFADQTSFEVGQRMALMLSHSSIIPDIYRSDVLKNGKWEKNPDAVGNCFIALELANRLGVSPIMVMQQVDVIHGRPSLRGTFLIGLVNGSGQFSPLEFECNELSGDAYGYRAKATNLATGKECIGPWITWKMVKAEKWNEKTGSKWNSMPELMFQYRSAAFWSRLFASHITLGLYESEEARDVFGDESPRGPQRAIPAANSDIEDLQRELAQRAAAAEKPKAPGKKVKEPEPEPVSEAPAESSPDDGLFPEVVE